MKNYISQFKSEIITSSFGLLADGREVFKHKISNANGYELNVSSYGAAITNLLIPISDSEKIDVVLGFDSAADYENSFSLPNAPYLGAAVGLYAGRIDQASFELNGKIVQLDQNHGPHQLHGGFKNLSNQIWNFDSEKSNEQQLVFNIVTKLNSANYNAEVSVTVSYVLTDDNAVKVRFTATPDQPTAINLTQHSYFNLDGDGRSVLSQKLKVFSESYLETKPDGIPTGKIVPTINTALNFTEVQNCPRSIDNTFTLAQPLAAVLYSPSTKIKLTVFTNQPAVHIYVGGNCFNTLAGKNFANYGETSGICFETQNYPDAPNQKHFPNSIIQAHETYFHESIFQFKTNKTE
ncbi:aldose epimerase family protein [Flavobacterium sp.]|uniref:aldose epimerase family protein n=1 Tax=Flavobacterium sp. TaxID=239 RepID=UPI0026135758|nr:aldose epimerase family protein [Flavobacterium sp.]